MPHALHAALAWMRGLWMPKPYHGIPAPPFKASKRTATIMYGLWYGHLSPEQAREKARGWGFAEASIEQMVADATKPPSYWSRQPQSEA